MKTKIKLLSSILIPMLVVVSTAIIGVLLQKEASAKKALIEQVSYSIETRQIDRSLVLEKFFGKYKSPLSENIETFIEVADKYDIDYRLLPAISCIESSCGKKLIPGSYNPFGWGIYGDNVIRFASYDEAIETVGKGLNENYFSKGFDTPEEIAPIYTPPGQSHWLGSVKYFIEEMNKIQEEIEG